MCALLAVAVCDLGPAELFLGFPGTCISATGESEIHHPPPAPVIGQAANFPLLEFKKNADISFGGTARVLLLLDKTSH